MKTKLVRNKTRFEKHVLPGLRVGGPVFVFQLNAVRTGKVVGMTPSLILVEVTPGMTERHGVATRTPAWEKPHGFSRFTGHSFKRNAWLV
jgi:hypothetical protein